MLRLMLITLLALPYGPKAPRPEATAYFAGGCFWGVEAVFDRVRGVSSAVSGFAVGADSAVNGPLRRHHTGYAETVRVSYDPSQVSYEQLLRIFFTVAHDPTQLDRQGPDTGPEYRSTVFVESADQRQLALAFVAQLAGAHLYPRPIVTEVVALRSFREAGREHQDFMAHNPTMAYVVINDIPKITRLRREFADLYREAH